MVSPIVIKALNFPSIIYPCFSTQVDHIVEMCRMFVEKREKVLMDDNHIFNKSIVVC